MRKWSIDFLNCHVILELDFRELGLVGVFRAVYVAWLLVLSFAWKFLFLGELLQSPIILTRSKKQKGKKRQHIVSPTTTIPRSFTLSFTLYVINQLL